jgi:hypothetical protein
MDNRGKSVQFSTSYGHDWDIIGINAKQNYAVTVKASTETRNMAKHGCEGQA